MPVWLNEKYIKFSITMMISQFFLTILQIFYFETVFFGKKRMEFYILLSSYNDMEGLIMIMEGCPGGSDSKASAHNAGGQGLIPRSGRSPGEGNGNPFQYSCIENPMHGGAWWATVHGVAKSQPWLSNFIHGSSYNTSNTFFNKVNFV